MQKALLIKALLVAVVIVVLLVPLHMINGIAAERADRQRAVVQEIMSSSYGAQSFMDPVLSLPYVEDFDETVKLDVRSDGDAKATRETRVVHHREQRVLYFFPDRTELAGVAAVGQKHRGLFKTRVFDWKAAQTGEFTLAPAAKLERTRDGSHITWGKPVISIGIGDPRGLNGLPKMQWAGRDLVFERGSALPNSPSGVHAESQEFDPTKPQNFKFSLTLELRGTESLAFVPLAGADKIKLSSAWPHPGFGGQMLPVPELQQARNDGFDATWQSSALASNSQLQLISLLRGASPACCPDRAEVRFIEPIDIYSLSDRALKYAFLFIALTFACLALFELMQKLRVHPAQYLLCGLALAVFFLLLISISEHLPFVAAYCVAAASSIALLGYYLAGVLQSRKLGRLFAAMLVALYSALYGLLISEDNTLLLGSILLFGVLAATMLVTRRLDWYGLGAKSPVTADA
jgi:inner membrane protein